jgi:hypothetical protein
MPDQDMHMDAPYQAQHKQREAVCRRRSVYRKNTRAEKTMVQKRTMNHTTSHIPRSMDTPTRNKDTSLRNIHSLHGGDDYRVVGNLLLVAD